MKRLACLVMWVVVSLLAGCGGSSSSSSPSSGNSLGGNVPTASANPASATGTLLVTLPATEQATSLRFFGLDDGGRVIYGPQGAKFAPQVTLNLVPLKVTSLRIEAVNGNRLVGIAVVPVKVIAFATSSVVVTAFVPVDGVVSLAIEPAAPVLAVGTRVQLSAVAVMSNGGTLDVTSVVIWNSTTPGVATVGNGAALAGLLTGVSTGSTPVTATIGGIQASALVTVTSATLQSITVAPVDPSVAVSGRLQMSASGTFSDGSTQDITRIVTWTSGAPNLASVSSDGVVVGAAPGATTIVAALGAVTGSTALTVTGASLQAIQVTPADVALPVGFTQQFVATAIFSDGSTADYTGFVTWNSTDPSVLAMAPSGVGTARKQGSVSVIATDPGGLTGAATATVTSATLVSLVADPSSFSTVVTRTVRIKVTGFFSDGTSRPLTSDLNWQSSSPGIATVGNAARTKGLVTAISPGAVQITATAPGPGAVSVSIAGTVVDDTVLRLEVSPGRPSIANKTAVQLTAIARMASGGTENVTEQVAWASSDSRVVSVTGGTAAPLARIQPGVAAARSSGTADVTATLPVSAIAPRGASVTTKVSVTDATLQVIVATSLPVAVAPPASMPVRRGQVYTLHAIGQFNDGTTQDLSQFCDWTSKSPQVATVETSGDALGLGLVRGVSAGTSVIAARFTPLATFGSLLVKVGPDVTSSDVKASTLFGGQGDETANAVAVDSRGNIYICGNTTSKDLPVTPKALLDSIGDRPRAFLAVLAADCKTLLYCTYLGGDATENSIDAVGSIAIGPKDTVYISGRTSSTTFHGITPDTAFQSALPASKGATSAFMLVLAPQSDTVAPLFFSPRYGTYFGGSVACEGHGMAVDGKGNGYVSGSRAAETAGDTPIPKSNKNDYRTDRAKKSDAFCFKIDPSLARDASLLFTAVIGGGGPDDSNALAVDGNQVAYLTGRTASEDFPVISSIMPFNRGASTALDDVFLAKFETNNPQHINDQSLRYCTWLGGESYDIGRAVAATDGGRAYLTGLTNSAGSPDPDHGGSFLTTKGALQEAWPPFKLPGASNESAFVACIDTNKTGRDALQYSSFLGGRGTVDRGAGIVLDGQGHVVVTGSTSSLDFPQFLAIQAFNLSGEPGAASLFDTFYAAFQTVDFRPIAMGYLGGRADDLADGAALNAASALITGGQTMSGKTFPTTPGAYQAGGDGKGFDSFSTTIDLGL